MRARRALLALGLAACAAAGAGLPRWQSPAAGHLGSELVAARRARQTVEEKLATREGETRDRVRALYKLSRAGLVPLWVDGDAGRQLVQTRAAARRLILRDLEERAALREEVARLAGDERRLQAGLDRAALEGAAELPAGSLRWPAVGEIVEEYGERRDRATRARLPGRGVLLATAPRALVAAPLGGLVLHAGRLGVLGGAVVVAAPEGAVAVVGELDDLRVAAGDAVEPGDLLGVARDRRVYVEIRRGGRPVDPAPLLAR